MQLLDRPRTIFALGKYCFPSSADPLFSSQVAWDREAHAGNSDFAP